MSRPGRLHEFKVDTVHAASSYAVEELELFNDENFRAFTFNLLYQVAAFSNVKIFKFAMEITHIHVIFGLCEDPDLKEGRDVILERIKHLYKPQEVAHIKRSWAELESQGGIFFEKELDRWRARMNNYSMFMKTFLQRLTQNYNSRNKRKGTLWRERFSCPQLTTEESLELTMKYIFWNSQRRAYALVSEQLERCKARLASSVISPADQEKVKQALANLLSKKRMIENDTLKADIPLSFLKYTPQFTCAQLLGSRERLLQLIGDRPYRIHHVINNLYCIGGWAVKVKKRE